MKKSYLSLEQFSNLYHERCLGILKDVESNASMKLDTIYRMVTSELTLSADNNGFRSIKGIVIPNGIMPLVVFTNHYDAKTDIIRYVSLDSFTKTNNPIFAKFNEPIIPLVFNERDLEFMISHNKDLSVDLNRLTWEASKKNGKIDAYIETKD